VIGSNRGGIPELIEGTGAGLVVDPDSTPELVEAVKKFAESRERVVSAATAAVSAADTYSLDRNGEALEAAYELAMANQK